MNRIVCDIFISTHAYVRQDYCRCGNAGNVATEDVVYMLSGFGIQHGVDLDALVDTSAFICKALGRTSGSHVAQAVLGARQRQTAMAA